MKAEHRKELETNTLADSMGQAVRNLRTRPRRRTVIYGAIAVGVLVAIFLTYRWWNIRKDENAQRWFFLADGSRTAILALMDPSSSNPAGKAAAEANPSTKAGKAAALQLAWIDYWGSLQALGGQRPAEALKNFKQLGEVRYPELAKFCADDPSFEPETLYFQAVVEETRAVEDVKRLDSAKEMYEKLADKHGKSAYGQRAAERIAVLNDPQRSKEVRQLYLDLKVGLGIRAAGKGNDFPDFHDLFKKK